MNKLDFHHEILQEKYKAHNYLLLVLGSAFLSWSFLDYYNNEPLAPIFLIIRLISFTVILTTTSPLNKLLFTKKHFLLTSVLLTLITSSSLFITLLSSNSYISNVFFLVISYVLLSLFYQAKIIFFIPTVLVPLLIFLFSYQTLSPNEMSFELAALKLFFLSIITTFSQWGTTHYKNKCYKISFKYHNKNKEMKKLLEDNNHLIRILCHDLGNAITVIEMSTQIFEFSSEFQNKNLKNGLGRIKRAVNTQEEIINFVKQKEELESGKKDITLSPVNVSVILEKAHFTFHDKLKEKNIIINTKYSGDDAPYVMAEQISLSNNVVNNILSNAIKFSRENSTIDILVETTKYKTKIQIRDYGIGMSGDTLNNLFCSTTKTTTLGLKGEKGTGFGMPLASLYMKKYHGKIDVESIPGQGTTFTLIFNSLYVKNTTLESIQKQAS